VITNWTPQPYPLWAVPLAGGGAWARVIGWSPDMRIVVVFVVPDGPAVWPSSDLTLHDTQDAAERDAAQS
jgi:hypothetical protein